ncbi:MAG: DNA repair protein RecN [Abditibacteriales bacterium]|nr:DNA repair protein RecN [Abditibacteriales bacterium]MDW8366778.1 DNA repair protein RecN [Abditibacteriales bacterium]
MLLELRVSNLALIDHVELTFQPGLNVLTGETGAGKSILIHAIGLLLGERGAAEEVGLGKRAATVEGLFDIRNHPLSQQALSELGIPVEEDGMVVLSRREITADGRSRCRINGRMATVTMLRDIGRHLVDLHGQHEHQSLLRVEAHLDFLDAFAGDPCQRLRAQFREVYHALKDAEGRLRALLFDEKQRAQRVDMLQFQMQEIDAAQLGADEDTRLIEERARLVNAEKLRQAAQACLSLLAGGEGVGAMDAVGRAVALLRDMQSAESAAAAWTETLQTALYQLQDVAHELRTYLDKLEADPARLEEIEARLHLLTRLKRKYGDTIEQILQHRVRIEEELQSLLHRDAQVAELEQQRAALRQQLAALGQQLSDARRKAARNFEEAVVTHLKSLAMDNVKFAVQIEPLPRRDNLSHDGSIGARRAAADSAATASRATGRDDDGGDFHFTERGMDHIEFLLSPNPGQPLRPLARIASGGELSRVMLALKTALSRRHEIPVLIFDEIDVGIGGAAAEAVGVKLKELAQYAQVFCVTHLPQIARYADAHFSVRKDTTEERTTVTVTRLSEQERVHELARMLGGAQVTEATLRHAAELVGWKP